MVVLSPVCSRVRSQVSLALDGELSQLERAMNARHLEGCAACRTFRDDLTAVTQAIRQAPLAPLERPVVLPRLRRARVAAVRGMAVRAGAAAAGIALVLGLGFDASSTFRSQPVTARPAYLDSMDLERELMREQMDRDNGTHMRVPA
jgi:predicted anti-sigma-YlaC factor YlaD